MGSRDQLLEFWDPPNNSGKLTARNFIFGKKMAGSEYEGKTAKLGQRGHVGSRDPLLESCHPLISLERLKLKNSNLTYTWMAVSTNEKNAKLGQKVSCGVT